MLFRSWALIQFFCLRDGRLFEVGANSRLGAYSNKYGNLSFLITFFLFIFFFTNLRNHFLRNPPQIAFATCGLCAASNFLFHYKILK